MHFQNSHDALIHNKNVICEKPFNKINVNSFEIVSDKVYHKVTNKTEDIIDIIFLLI